MRVSETEVTREQNLLQVKIQEQHMLDECSRPHTWGGTRRRYRRLEPIQQAPPIQVYQQPPPEPPRIIQHTLPQQPATIIQQLPHQQPLITQIPPPQALPPIRSGSIKEDMVELMLMQNAQMHQIIMHNMMLKALPPMAFCQPGSSASPVVSHGQDIQSAVPFIVKAEKPRPSSVHHHHHYSAQGQSTPHPPPLPPIGQPLWPSMLPSNPMAQHSNIQPSVQHLMGPTVTLPALQTETVDGTYSRMPPGL
ncbi:uncharacterized protein C21orf58-like [Carcharodon carcharias]|uniref:uncharacterized protein C21orf58-like n=1 Tax=Carcharodon carcharias TaxID=13397 RepID=UPI001B7E377A|nr:uncharacterized protein C21orf58-like [Carcharodon carcharias]